jgi:hypothetical protein
MQMSNPIYQRIQRSGRTLWRVATAVLLSIAAIYIVASLIWFVPETSMIRQMQDVLNWLTFLDWMLLLLLPAIPALSAAALTAGHAGSDQYALIRLTQLTSDEIVHGYYEGVRQRSRLILAGVLVVSTASVLVSNIVAAGLHLAVFNPFPFLYLPVMLLYLDMMSHVGTALGVWAGLRFRDTAKALALTTAGVMGIPLVLVFLFMPFGEPVVMLLAVPPCLCLAVLLPMFLSSVDLHDRLLKHAEKWV